MAHSHESSFLRDLKEVLSPMLPTSTMCMLKKFLGGGADGAAAAAVPAHSLSSLLAAVERLPVGLILIDSQTHRITFSNSAARNLLAYDPIGSLLTARAHELEQVGEVTRRSEAGELGLPVADSEIGMREWEKAAGEATSAIWVLQDDCSIKKIEKALLESEERFRLATLATHEAIWDWDLGTDTLRWNEALRSMLKHADVSFETSIHWWFEHIHPDDQQRVASSVDAVVAGSQVTWQDEYRFLCGDGSYAQIKDRCYIVRDAFGKAVRMIGAMQDVTRESAALEQLRASEADFRELAETIPQLVFISDLAGQITFYNQRWYAFVGLDPMCAEHAPWHASKNIHADDVERTTYAWNEALRTGEPFQIECRIRRHDGVYRWHLCRALLLRDLAGQPIKWLGTHTDIHQQHMLGEQLAMAVSVARLGFWDLCVESSRSSWNEQHRQHFDYPEGQYDSDTAEILTRVHPDDRAALRRVFENDPSLGERFQCEFRVLLGDGRIRWLEFQGERHVNHGLAPSLTGTSLDITDRKMAEEHLHAAKDAAESASKLKSTFLANMSHEIRTPLCAILGYSELLRDRSLADDERDRYIETINRAGRALTHVIDDILDLSKVEAGKLETEAAPVKVRALLDDVVELFAAHARSKGIYLKQAVDASVPEVIRSDPTRVRQILVNLVSNALKFTSEGGVEIFAKAQMQSEGRVAIVIKVKDTGVGIEPAQQSRLFQAFSQVDSSASRRHGGTGLGLALSRGLARSLGGDITLEDSSSRGSCFTLQFQGELLPASEAQEASISGIVQDGALGGVRVLLAEDAPENQLLISRLLTMRGARVSVVANGAEALHAAQQGDFDIVLMDIQMPVLDGYAATRALRAAGYAKPIVALTAHAMLEEQKKTRDAGCDAHLTKPIDVAAMVACVKSLAATIHAR